MAENQSAHRQEVEKFVVQGGSARADRGQHYAFAIAIACLLPAAFFGWLRLPWLAGTAPNWQNHRFGGTSSFVVELRPGALSRAARGRLSAAGARISG